MFVNVARANVQNEGASRIDIMHESQRNFFRKHTLKKQR